MGAGPATGCRSAQMNDGQVAVNKQSFLSDITHSMFYKKHSLDSGEVKRQVLVGGELIRDIFLQIHLNSWLKVAYYYIQGYFSPFTLNI